jgi:hypothetical protein
MLSARINHSQELPMAHSIEPPKAETLEELGIELGKLRYDALEQVLRGLHTELARQAGADFQAERPQLGVLGSKAAGLLFQVQCIIGRMLDISTPYMEKDIKERPIIR